MKGIYIAAAITTIVSLMIWGSVVFWKIRRDLFPVVLGALLLELPMCAAAFYLVRTPLDGLLRDLLGAESLGRIWLSSLYAPLTEEPAKLLPLLLPWILRKTDPSSYLRVGLALGLGFGVGEIWFVAYGVATNPQMGNLPWYLFSGFLFERLFVCLAHGAFTATALRLLRRRFALGVLAAMALHFLLNFPIFLAGRDLGGLGSQAWQATLGVWTQVYIAGMGGLLVYYKLSDRAPAGAKPTFWVWQVLSAILSLSPGAPLAIPALVLTLRAQKDWDNGLEAQSRSRVRRAKWLFAGAAVLSTVLLTAGMGLIMSLVSGPPPARSEETVEPVPVEGEEREAILRRVDPLADNLLEGYNEGDYARFSRDMTDEMTSAIPWFSFVSSRWTLMSVYGRYRSRTPTVVSSVGERGALVVYHGVFDRDPHVEIRFGIREVDGHDRVSTLFFREPEPSE